MVKLLRIDLRIVTPTGPPCRGAIFMDTQPAAANHSVPAYIPVLAVLDHHRPPATNDERTRSVRMTAGAVWDVRENQGCTSALVYEYLVAAGLVPDPTLATALLLGIQTDTDHLLRDAAPADVAAYAALLPLADLGLAARISRPAVPPDWFRLLRDAVNGAERHGTVLVAHCGAVAAPDWLSTVSDLLALAEGVERVLVTGSFEGRLYFSLRQRPPWRDAAVVARRIVADEGGGGGHDLSAGGSLPLDESSEARAERRFLEAVDAGAAGVSLIGETP